MILSSKEKNRLKSKYGEWAIITGASSGIGLELAQQLAGAGFNLILNARNGLTLEEVKDDLEKKYLIEVKTIAADIAEADTIDEIINATKGLKLGLLINSAGYGTSGLFTNASIHQEIDMLRVNCKAVLALTHYFAQKFIQQKSGGIIFLSSIVAFQGVPKSANYAATKAFIQTFAEGLAVELKPFNVDVLAAAPGPVASGFANRANMYMAKALKTSEIGIPILKALGKQTTVYPGLLSKVLVYSLKTVPRWAKTKIMTKVMEGMTAHQKN